jgi:dolichyl-phosphooligosaccharide-protein glycotransferase
VIAFPALVRRTLVLVAVAFALWIRLLPLALDGTADAAAGLVRDRVRDRLVATGQERPAAADVERRIDAWIAAHPAVFARARAVAAARVRREFQYRGADGRQHAYLGDYDSYLWLREARNDLRTGTTCDAVVDGRCRDTYANAPVGGPMRYARSLHVAVIVGLHRLVTLVHPDAPLPATAFLVPVIVGALGVFPAFGIGRRLAGDLGGLFAAIVAVSSPLVLARSVGSDNDVWNVVLPLFMVWAAMRALAARSAAAGLVWAALAGVGAGLHAATWRGWVFTYAVVLCGLGGALVVRGARTLGGGRGKSAAGAAQALVAFYAAAGLACAVGAPHESYLGLPARMLAEVVHPPAAAAAAWPSVLDTVAELARPGRSEIAATMGGPLSLFAGWLGLLVMLLPPRGWQWWHFALLIAGNYLYLHLVTGPELGRESLVVLLALPLLAAILLETTLDRRRGADTDPSDGGRLIVALWLLAALFYAYGAARFVLLLAAPLGIAVAVAAGRLYAWLDRGAQRLPAPAASLGRLVVVLIVALGLVRPVERAYDVMDAYLPEISDVWSHTLARLRATTPADAIVATWWDYGHWVKYVAERRTSADGSTLLTHVPHWLGRALLAPSEAEAVGILRMLGCGSDATPEAEGRLGAYGKLVARGLGEGEAYRLLVDLIRRDAAGARAVLAARGLDAAASDDVLASTHCTPPPTYLVLASDMTARPAWRRLGATTPAGAAASLDAGTGARAFLRREWIGCAASGTADEVACPLTGLAGGDAVMGRFVYRRSAPAAGHLLLAGPSSDGGERILHDWRPAVALVATSAGIEEAPAPAEADPRLGVVVDTAHERVLLGAPAVMRSTFVRLLLLDGRGMRRFVKVDERRRYDGMRVVTWQVRW